MYYAFFFFFFSFHISFILTFAPSLPPPLLLLSFHLKRSFCLLTTLDASHKCALASFNTSTALRVLRARPEQIRSAQFADNRNKQNRLRLCEATQIHPRSAGMQLNGHEEEDFSLESIFGVFNMHKAWREKATTQRTFQVDGYCCRTELLFFFLLCWPTLFYGRAHKRTETMCARITINGNQWNQLFGQ